MAKRKKSNKEAQLLVATTYWFVDQAYKAAATKRDTVREITLTAIPAGETVGPVMDDEDMPHWLTHGERETVEMSAITLSGHMVGIAEYCKVDVAKLKAECPKVYAKMLEERTTARTTHDCLTWADKPKRRGKHL